MVKSNKEYGAIWDAHIVSAWTITNGNPTAIHLGVLCGSIGRAWRLHCQGLWVLFLLGPHIKNVCLYSLLINAIYIYIYHHNNLIFLVKWMIVLLHLLWNTLFLFTGCQSPAWLRFCITGDHSPIITSLDEMNCQSAITRDFYTSQYADCKE